MGLPKIIDNGRVQLAETLREIARDHSELSIATGYWDLPGTAELMGSLRGYDKIRLLIGQEPLIPRHAKRMGIQTPELDFPDEDFTYDLTQIDDPLLRSTIQTLKQLIQDEVLEVRVYRRSFLHAKTYIFGNYHSKSAVGIIGSSNFTRAGLTTNTELNALEPNYQVVKFRPMAATDEHGHLSWFNSMWDDELTEKWNQRFTEILEDSPLGDVTFGPYDMYLRTLMEVYPDELLPKATLADDTKDVLYWFQQRNAQILINKLDRMGLAMLSDSVGLGKTITAGAVIKHYKELDASRIYVIAPAGLKQQWKEDLAARFSMTQGFEIISMQDARAINEARKIDQYKEVDLFVIDESHNLRNENSKRHSQLLDWFINNPESKVLMLTATPINNSLMDFVSQIQLASKGQLNSIDVDYRDENNRLHKLDFFDALKRIQSRITRAEKEGKKFDWGSIREIVASGLRHYLVRSTRQGIKDTGGIRLSDGTVRNFPDSRVQQIGYHYSRETAARVERILTANLPTFEGLDPRKIDVESLLELTQRSAHPLDEIRDSSLVTTNAYMGNVFVNIYQLVLLLGFAPYKPDIYTHRIHGKTMEVIRSLGLQGDESFRVQSQLSIHNMLRITLLKRIESSHAAFKKSLENYQEKLHLFEAFLDNGLILKFHEMSSITEEYGEDIETAVDRYLEESGQQRSADPKVYNIEALRFDIDRDKKLVAVLIELAKSLSAQDDKLEAFAQKIQEIRKDPNPAAKKILVFSYFADTIKYLEAALPGLIGDPDFEERAAFITGGSRGSVDSIVNKFSPLSKKYELIDSETPIDYLFATDVLSEGQNLQDAGTLINYDLHWNPVRMIQRNGRINRLGSEFDEVFIYNMKPEDNLENYLRLSRRLERKIDTIKHTIGTDQNITKEGQVAPKEYIEDLDTTAQELLDELGDYEARSVEGDEAQDFDTTLLYGDDGDSALEVLVAQEEDFYVEDQFVYELRNFLSSHSEEEIERIKTIPMGKWGYLPERTSLSGQNVVMGLARITGRTSITGAAINDTQFVNVECWGDYKASPIEDMTALKYLRTGPEDNERTADSISVQRDKAKKRTLAATRAQVRKKVLAYQPKKSELETLQEFERLLPGRDLATLITLRVSNNRELKRAQSILREARAELRAHGQILPSSITAMESLSSDLASNPGDETIISQVESVLFYAKK